MEQIARGFYPKETSNLGTRGGGGTTTPQTSLRFMPTRHEVGLRRNPSTVSNYAQKKLDEGKWTGKVRRRLTRFSGFSSTNV